LQAYGKEEFFDNDDLFKERRRMLSDGASQLYPREDMVEEKFDIFCDSRFSLTEPKFLRICTVDPVFKLVGIKKILKMVIKMPQADGLLVQGKEDFWNCKNSKRFTLEASTEGIEHKLKLLDEFFEGSRG
jgi:hypothetical protein